MRAGAIVGWALIGLAAAPLLGGALGLAGAALACAPEGAASGTACALARRAAAALGLWPLALPPGFLGLALVMKSRVPPRPRP